MWILHTAIYPSPIPHSSMCGRYVHHPWKVQSEGPKCIYHQMFQTTRWIISWYPCVCNSSSMAEQPGRGPTKERHSSPWWSLITTSKPAIKRSRMQLLSKLSFIWPGSRESQETCQGGSKQKDSHQSSPNPYRCQKLLPQGTTSEPRSTMQLFNFNEINYSARDRFLSLNLLS